MFGISNVTELVTFGNSNVTKRNFFLKKINISISNVSI